KARWPVCRPPIAQHRIVAIVEGGIEFLAKDTRLKQVVMNRYTNEEVINILALHCPDRGRHAMRYFGLLSPRSKARLWSAVFALLNQTRQKHRPRLTWRLLRMKSFGIDPLIDAHGQPMRWVGRREPNREPTGASVFETK